MTFTNVKTLYRFFYLSQGRPGVEGGHGHPGDLESPITEVARAIPKGFFAAHKMIYRFLKRAPLKEALLRLFPEDAPFVIYDPTGIPRPKGPPMWAGSRTGRPGDSSFWSSHSLTKGGPSLFGSLCSHPAPSPG